MNVCSKCIARLALSIVDQHGILLEVRLVCIVQFYCVREEPCIPYRKSVISPETLYPPWSFQFPYPVTFIRGLTWFSMYNSWVGLGLCNPTAICKARSKSDTKQSSLCCVSYHELLVCNFLCSHHRCSYIHFRPVISFNSVLIVLKILILRIIWINI